MGKSFLLYSNNKAADQPAHARSLVSVIFNLCTWLMQRLNVLAGLCIYS